MRREKKVDESEKSNKSSKIKAKVVTPRAPLRWCKSKHFERWAAYVRDLFQRHIIGVEYVNTDDMPADIFTKPLPFDAFTKHRATLLNA